MNLLVAFLALAPSGTVGPPPGMHQAQAKDFDFANAWESPCSALRREGPDPAYADACKKWSDPQYFHGVWEVGFETSNLTFMGKMECSKMQDHSCINLKGEVLPWPKSECTHEFELKFIGRRSLYAVPGHLGVSMFTVTVDKVLYARKLPAPYNWRCGDEPENE